MQCVLIFSIILSEILLILRRTAQDMTKQIYRVIQEESALLLEMIV